MQEKRIIWIVEWVVSDEELQFITAHSTKHRAQQAATLYKKRKYGSEIGKGKDKYLVSAITLDPTMEEI